MKRHSEPLPGSGAMWPSPPHEHQMKKSAGVGVCVGVALPASPSHQAVRARWWRRRVLRTRDPRSLARSRALFKREGHSELTHVHQPCHCPRASPAWRAAEAASATQSNNGERDPSARLGEDPLLLHRGML